MIKPESIKVYNSIEDILRALEAKVDEHMVEFLRHVAAIEEIKNNEHAAFQVHAIEDQLLVMAEIFHKLRPIEGLIRLRYADHNKIFDQLITLREEEYKKSLFYPLNHVSKKGK